MLMTLTCLCCFRVGKDLAVLKSIIFYLLDLVILIGILKLVSNL